MAFRDSSWTQSLRLDLRASVFAIISSSLSWVPLTLTAILLSVLKPVSMFTSFFDLSKFSVPTYDIGDLESSKSDIC